MIVNAPEPGVIGDDAAEVDGMDECEGPDGAKLSGCDFGFDPYEGQGCASARDIAKMFQWYQSKNDVPNGTGCFSVVIDPRTLEETVQVTVDVRRDMEDYKRAFGHWLKSPPGRLYCYPLTGTPPHLRAPEPWHEPFMYIFHQRKATFRYVRPQG